MGRCNHWTWHGTHLFEYTKQWQRNVAVGEGISSVRKALQAGGLHGSKSPTIFDAHMRQRWPTHACLHIWHRLNQSQPRTPPSPRSNGASTFPAATHADSCIVSTSYNHTYSPTPVASHSHSHCFHTYSPTPVASHSHSLTLLSHIQPNPSPPHSHSHTLLCSRITHTHTPPSTPRTWLARRRLQERNDQHGPRGQVERKEGNRPNSP